ncbi:MAG: hypothetical protein ACLQOO_31295 [Terriglobia bacterium]
MSREAVSKISPQFASALGHLRPDAKVRVIVMLDFFPGSSRSGQRRSPGERKATIDATRQSAKHALLSIDNILDRFHGRRLAEDADALGSVPVEATRAGIEALAASEHVKAILEDQPISVLTHTI